MELHRSNRGSRCRGKRQTASSPQAEFAGIVVNPNSSVNSVTAIPMQAITPRISRKGLIGRCSAMSGLGIKRAVIDSKLSRKRKLSFWGAHAARVLFAAPSRQISGILTTCILKSSRWRGRHRQVAAATASPEVLLTRCVCASKLNYEN